MAKIFDNEKLKNKFQTLVYFGKSKKLNEFLDKNTPGDEKENIDYFFITNYLNSSLYNSDVMRVLLNHSHFSFKHLSNHIYSDFAYRLFKKDKELMLFTYENGVLDKLLPTIEQRIFNEDREFFLRLMQVKDVGGGILNDLIKSNDKFAYKMIDSIKSLENYHFESAMNANVSPEILRHLFTKGEYHFDDSVINKKEGILVSSIKLICNRVRQGDGFSDIVEKMQIILDNCKISSFEARAFIDEIEKINSFPVKKIVVDALKEKGVCNKIVNAYLLDDSKRKHDKLEYSKEMQARRKSKLQLCFHLIDERFAIEKEIVLNNASRGNWKTLGMFKNEVKSFDFYNYKEEINEGYLRCVDRAKYFNEELVDEVYTATYNMVNILKSNNCIDILNTDNVIKKIDKFEKEKTFNFKYTLNDVKRIIYYISKSINGKAVADILNGGKSWYVLLNKNIELQDDYMAEIVENIIKNINKYGFNAKLLDKIFKIKGFKLNKPLAEHLLVEAVNKLATPANEQRNSGNELFLRYLLNNSKVTLIKGIDWQELVLSRDVQRYDDLYDKVLNLALKQEEMSK